MKRDLQRLQEREFDLLVVGGGIMGLAAAREGALRGLTTAVVEKSDLAGATSANSLKLIHGGLRYLQHADLPRLRQSVRERRAMMRLAPHLVFPLPFLIPTYGHLAKGAEAMRAAFLLYGLLAADRNRLPDPGKRIPLGSILSREECLALFPGFRREKLTGGAVFHDGQAWSTERLALGFARAADRAGAAVASWTRVTGFLGTPERVTGCRVRDELGGGEFDIRARMVLNAAGPWADDLLGLLPRQVPNSGYLPAKAVNIVVPRLLCPTHAVGLEVPAEASDSLVKRGGRLFFITPWRGCSIIGTTYHTWRHDPDTLDTTVADIRELIDGVNAAWPQAALQLPEVVSWHCGIVPTTSETGPGGVHLAKSDLIIDHRQGGVDGLLTLIGVKYTTARDLAERTVRLVASRLGKPFPDAPSTTQPLPGGEMESFEGFLAQALKRHGPALGEDTVQRLAHAHGTGLEELLALGATDPALLAPLPGNRALGAEVVHAVRSEMALTLGDVIFRRTELAATGNPGEEALAAAARLVAAELGWTPERTAREIATVRAAFVPRP